jgi:AraC-like DNA-binding protein
MTITRHGPGDSLARHRHVEGYAAVVLTGSYVEAGRGARASAVAGDVIVHGAFDAHQDRFGRRGATVLNLPLVHGMAVGTGRVDDVDRIVVVAGSDEVAAAELLGVAMRPVDLGLGDWVDLLALDLVREGAVPMAQWADRLGIRRQSLSRGFLQAFGVTPQRYRLEQRARTAVDALSGWQGPLSTLAADIGFADQAHMTRAVAALTGEPPGRLRCNAFKTDPGRARDDR